jgi:glycosyltransferase involved in cell wall biosynthesis
MPSPAGSPLFSVVIPTYNRAKDVVVAADSVLTQDSGDAELIVVDDRSTDSTQAALEPYRQRGVKILLTPANGGASAARNLGIQVAAGKYVLFLDDDDAFLPGALDLIRAHLARYPDLGFSWAGMRLEKQDSAGRMIETCDDLYAPPGDRPSGSGNLDYVLRIGTNSALCVRREAFERIGLFDLSLRRSEDRDLLLRLAEAGYQGLALPQVLVRVQVHTRGSLSRPQGSRMTPDADEAVIAKHGALLQRPEHHAFLMQYYGNVYELHCDNRHFFAALRYLGMIALGRPSRLGRSLERFVRVFSGLEWLKERLGYHQWKNRQKLRRTQAAP